MILLAFDRDTEPIDIERASVRDLPREELDELTPDQRYHRYPHEPIPDMQSGATERTVLRNAARRVGLPEPWTRPALEKRFDLRRVSRQEAEAIRVHYFGAAQQAERDERGQRRQRANAVRKRLLIRDEDGTTVREMTGAEFRALAYARGLVEDLLELD